MIRIKRVYEPFSPSDGARFLVERLWPRGMKKESLRMDGWLRDVAPSTELRQWFGHDPAKWGEFQRRYQRELDARPDVCRPLFEAAGRRALTLLYSAKDNEHNAAVALKAYLEKHAGRKATSGRSRSTNGAGKPKRK